MPSLTLALDHRLAELAIEVSQPNWDGYGAPPLTDEVFQVAEAFLEGLPTGFPAPEISASAAGDISFEWARSASRVVSIGISPDGTLHYASLDGTRRAYGSMPVYESLDGELAALINRVLA